MYKPGILTDEVIWYKSYYFAQLSHTTVLFFRIYFSELTKTAHKQKVFEESIENISEQLIKHLCHLYEDELENTLRRIKETKAAKLMEEIRDDFD